MCDFAFRKCCREANQIPHEFSFVMLNILNQRNHRKTTFIKEKGSLYDC